MNGHPLRLGLGALLATSALAQDGPTRIDLPTALRLAGARSLDVKLAAERVTLARAEQALAQQQFFPWVSAGTAFRGHENNIQTVDGQIISADKVALDAGAAVRAQVEFGEAWFRTLVARQNSRAAENASDAQKQDAQFVAASGYFELVRANASVQVIGDAVRIAEQYANQVQRAVEVGLAPHSETLRIQTQAEQARLTRRQAEEQRRVAAARLASALHLDPAVDLLPRDAVPVALDLFPNPRPSLGSLIRRAIAQRPEIHQNASLQAAAGHARDGTIYGPLIPSLGAQGSFGTLGGGRRNELGDFGSSSDYGVTLSWRIGPGGLFDRSRVAAAESRSRMAALEGEKLRDAVATEVVVAHAHVRSLRDQVVLSQRALGAAQETLRLSRDRQEFGVAVVLETIQAQQELTRARLGHVAIVAEHNRAQFQLRRALGPVSVEGK
jgi:outer membrane protein TolC